MARPILSIIISAKNEADRVVACFDSLAKLKCSRPFEVHLVDNNSSDGTFQKAKYQANKYKNFFVWREKKPGSPAARNLGARKARGQILIFTDADCLFSQDWLEEISKPFFEEVSYPLGAVGGRTLSAYANPTKPNLVERYLNDLFKFWDLDRISAFPAFLPWAPTCNLAVKKDIFLQLGGFDEQWRSAAYDVDFCWRLVLCGFFLGYAPKAQVHHLRRNSLQSLAKQMSGYSYYNHSLLKTYEKLHDLSKLRIQKNRIESKTRRTISQMRKTKNLRQLSFRLLDIASEIPIISGNIKALVYPARPDSRYNSTRRGETPKKLLRSLPRGYYHLHQHGWCYWKNPADLELPGDLVLFKPKKQEWFRLNESAWKIWEVKSEGGQSEDAASALGQDDSNPEILRDIDELTLQLRTRRFLP